VFAARNLHPEPEPFIMLQDIMPALHTFQADTTDMAIYLSASDQCIWRIRLALVV
jgi:hypothetical protein